MKVVVDFNFSDYDGCGCGMMWLWLRLGLWLWLWWSLSSSSSFSETTKEFDCMINATPHLSDITNLYEVIFFLQTIF